MRAAALAAILALATSASAQMAPEQRAGLLEAREAIRSWAIVCPPEFGPFAGQHTHTAEACLQGDTNFVSGISCLAAELAEDGETADARCGDVAKAQGPDGRWWRGPTLVEQPYPGTFSRDQARGTLAYFLARGYISSDTERNQEAWSSAERWLGYIAGPGQGDICPEETRTCEITVGTANLMFNVFRHTGNLPPPAEAKKLHRSQWWLTRGLWAETVGNQLDYWARGKFYPFHLKAISLLILRSMNMNRDFSVRNRRIARGLGRVARTLHRMDLDNLLFDFLRNGNRQAFVEKVLAAAPRTRPEGVLGNWYDWAWQRHSSEKAWERSDGWDWIFLINLMLARDAGRLSW